MSVKNLEKSIIINDAMTAEIIETIDFELYRAATIDAIIKDIVTEYVFDQQHGITIKIGYKN